MFKSLLTAALALTSLTSTLAAPAPVMEKRAHEMNITDINILNYALTLEHLEANFYATGLANFSADAFTSAGYPSYIRDNIAEIGRQEAQHVSFLSTALGAAAVEACTYQFPVTDVPSFLAVAQVLEGVGVSAYLGAAKDIQVKDYLTAAGSILTVEARHSAWLRSAVGGLSPFPAAEDTPLDYDEVYTLASAFITACPSTNSQLPPDLMAFPALAASPASGVKPNDTITLTTDANPDGEVVYAAFISALSTVWSEISPSGQVKVPAALAPGQVYVVLTKNGTSVADEDIVAGPAIVDVLVDYIKY
ncbi:hypothetical protein G7K_2760-t1 [Saitoella complicata NRRL Y-17804]|uniref:Uncharacterized protein n=2 Tax=Saitoella complicata (strain BCRC 22490 / CBS 7301 / JCM 7358 / NBRC 10748 / NRRL Y-17804) TaxID=698492 RepID=A0A0E9NFE7_SAICN|nr:hypothetical protein G7K_2760-t1 [Saitoella complicata NRRL Y-17804]